MGYDDTEAELSEIVRSMSKAEGVTPTLESAVASVLDIMEHAEHAGISLVRKGQRVETPAATDDVVRRGDELQYELNEGPCLQSIWQQETVQSHDLTTEERWPVWSRRAADELGIRSMMCFQLFVTDDSLGALNLYSKKARAFDTDDRITGLAVSAHVAVALASAQNFESLEGAITSRTVIGQAEGMLIQRYQLKPDQAFSVLARMSQHSNRRLREIAADLVRDGIAED